MLTWRGWLLELLVMGRPGVCLAPWWLARRHVFVIEGKFLLKICNETFGVSERG